jgi:hypothetical protein
MGVPGAHRSRNRSALRVSCTPVTR